MKARSVVGALIGGVVDIVTTNIVAIPVAVVAIVRTPPGTSTHGIAHALGADPALSTTMMILGGAASVLGGYTAAWIARRDHLVVGAMSAYLCVAIGVFAWVHDTSGTPLLLHLGGFVLSPALGLLGGYLRRARTLRVAAA